MDLDRRGNTGRAWGRPRRCRLQSYIAPVVVLMTSVLSTGSSAAEERAEPIRIGAVNASWGPTPSMVGLRDGLLELGYRENEDFVLGVRFTQGDLTALPAAARELVEYGVDIIIVSQQNPAKAVQMATSRIPIVFLGVDDPVGIGLIESFARPGSNITGVADLHLELGPKRLQVFKEIVPSLKRVLFPYDANDVYSVAAASVYREAARRLGIELVEQAVRTREEARATLAQVGKGEVDGIVQPSTPSLDILGFMLEATVRRGIPTMYNAAFWVERGALASYGPDYYESGRQAARLVDKILKGADPAEIPVEVNSEIEFAINLKVAKALGLTISPNVLYRADRLVR
ncbi:MAG: ABC transporter substrate-binding protein [Candidatus Methylomirabilales bacterium]